MPLLETLPVDPRTAQWSLWSTTARIVVTDPAALPDARAITEAWTDAVDAAASRFRDDSELSTLPVDGHPAVVSPLLAELLEVALLAAARTDGAVDPLLGAQLVALGYDRDFGDLAPGLADVGLVVPGAPVAAWRRVALVDGDPATVQIPAGARLDLGATAKAWAADRCAVEIARCCGVGVLVSLGGDLATAGPAPDGGWQIDVGDGPGEPRCTIRLGSGGSLATSSTVSRTWQRGGQLRHHLLDPRTGAPAAPVWRTVSVAASSCVDSNTLSTAAVVRGLEALPWLRSLGVPARLVGASGKVVLLGGWPS